MFQMLTAVVVLMLTMAGWLGVQQLYRNFEKNNPECGPFREDGGNTACKCCANRHLCQVNRA
ncbi:hypothetical protein GZ77_25335 [Endozoicomonas montiporae]|uniref:Uncharacterized protein n=1 Tax=Endozoicomonas montiporae TaxID=1027273 RepID=A0A081MZ07_9GAMM|nr:hypothetical protein GZ77_25335 [Endozoicomonas montiporae]